MGKKWLCNGDMQYEVEQRIHIIIMIIDCLMIGTTLDHIYYLKINIYMHLLSLYQLVLKVKERIYDVQ